MIKVIQVETVSNQTVYRLFIPKMSYWHSIQFEHQSSAIKVANILNNRLASEDDDNLEILSEFNLMTKIQFVTNILEPEEIDTYLSD